MHRTCQSCVIFSNITAGRVMSNPLRFDVTNGYSCQIAIKCDCSLINSDAMGHCGVIMCNKVTNVISLCIQIKYTVICGIGACSVSNAAEPFVTAQYFEIYRIASYLLVLCHISNIIAGRVMSNPFRFDFTNGYSCQIAIKCDCSLINSDAMVH